MSLSPWLTYINFHYNTFVFVDRFIYLMHCVILQGWNWIYSVKLNWLVHILSLSSHFTVSAKQIHRLEWREPLSETSTPVVTLEWCLLSGSRRRWCVESQWMFWGTKSKKRGDRFTEVLTASHFWNLGWISKCNEHGGEITKWKIIITKETLVTLSNWKWLPSSCRCYCADNNWRLCLLFTGALLCA